MSQFTGLSSGLSCIMNKMRLLLFSALIAGVFFVGCGQNSDEAVKISGGKPIASISGQELAAWLKAEKFSVSNQCQQQAGTVSEKQQCLRVQSKGLRTRVFNDLISAAWVIDEAQSLGISLSSEDKALVNADVQAGQINLAKKIYPKGFSPEYIRQRSRATIIFDNIVDAETKSSGKSLKVNRNQAYRVYQQSGDLFNRPEARDFIFVTAPNKGVAQVISRRLRQGDSLKDIFKDIAAPPNALEEATVRSANRQKLPKSVRFVFELPRGRVIGPKKINNTYTVAQVTKIYPAQRVSFREAYPRAVELAKKDYFRIQLVSELEDKWRPRTTCSEGYNSPLCSNRPRRSVD